MTRINFNKRFKITIVDHISSLCCNYLFIYALIFIVICSMYLFLRLNSILYLMISICMIVGLFIHSLVIKYQYKETILYTHEFYWTKILLNIYSICFLSSIIYLKFIETNYHKSLIYYILISVCIISIFLLSITNNGKNRLLNIFLLVALSLNIFLSNSIIFPYGVYCSADGHFQFYNIVMPILENGTVPLGFTYSVFPIHQIYVSIVSLVTDINPMNIYRYLVAITYSIALLFIYVICKRTIGLIYVELSIIFYLISPEVIYNATHAYQYSYALPIGLLVMFLSVFLILPKKNKSSTKETNNISSLSILHLITLLTLLFTHHFTSIYILLLIGIIYFILYLFNCKNISFFFNIIILFFIMLLAHWIYVSLLLVTFKDIIDVYSSSLFGLENYQAAMLVSSSSHKTSFLVIFMDVLVKGIIFMLTTVGTLYGLWKKEIYIYLMASWGLFIFILISVGSFIKMPLLLAGRLFPLFFIVSAVYLSAKGTLILKERFGRKGIIIIIILLFFTSISGLGNIASGSETSIFIGNEPSLKFYDTLQDVKLKEWIISSISCDSIVRFNEPWKLSYSDKSRQYIDLLVNDNDEIELSDIGPGEYIVLTGDYLDGFQITNLHSLEIAKLVAEKKKNTAEVSLYSRLTKLDLNELDRVSSNTNCIYSNSKIKICLVSRQP